MYVWEEAMILDDPRTLVIGATGLVWGRITERTGADLTGTPVEIRTVSPDGTISAWAAPAQLDTSLALTGVVRAALSHVAAATGVWELQAKVGTEIVKCGPFYVVDA